MTFDITPQEFDTLRAQLTDSHQAILTSSTDQDAGTTRGTITTVDGKIAADFTYTSGALQVNLTRHDGYPGFIANAGLKEKLNAAIENIRKGA